MDKLDAASPSQAASPVIETALAMAREAASDARLDRKTRIRIGLYMARRGLGALHVEALRERGSAAGMNGAEMAANEAGTSHDAVATACLHFVAALLEDAQAPSPAQLRALRDAGFRRDEIAAIVVEVGMNRMLARLYRVIIAPAATLHCN